MKTGNILFWKELIVETNFSAELLADFLWEEVLFWKQFILLRVEKKLIRGEILRESCVEEFWHIVED